MSMDQMEMTDQQWLNQFWKFTIQSQQELISAQQKSLEQVLEINKSLQATLLAMQNPYPHSEPTSEESEETEFLDGEYDGDFKIPFQTEVDSVLNDNDNSTTEIRE